MVLYQHFPLGKDTNDTFFPCVVCVRKCPKTVFIKTEQDLLPVRIDVLQLDGV
jgi:hypothetical protein